MYKLSIFRCLIFLSLLDVSTGEELFLGAHGCGQWMRPPVVCGCVAWIFLITSCMNNFF